MGRDHSIQCDRCGAWYGGFDGPDECPCMATLVNDGNRVAVLREWATKQIAHLSRPDRKDIPAVITARLMLENVMAILDGKTPS